MKKLTYVSNLSLANTSGGMSGINSATYNQLKNNFNITEYEIINPKQDIVSKVVSKIKRTFNIKSKYHFFSEKRLNIIASAFSKSVSNSNDIFFHGFTPWIKTRPKGNYYCFNDACFATYVSLYNNRESFSENDLERIFKQEAQWLFNAKAVFFQSSWALEETKKAYKISGDNFIKVGVGGYIDIPDKDDYNGGFDFLFISREFKPKGGEVVAKAFKIIKEKHPNSYLNIVGDAPPENLQQLPGVNYIGFINKNIESERERLVNLFKQAFVVLHPTKKDINPLILSELGYYGCPAITSNAFAIPEYVVDGETGFLLKDILDVEELVAKMDYLITNKEAYTVMRSNARKNAIENNTWDAVGQRITKVINNNDL
jgi:glycosyltransferase involved in cell wall biosynthesis